MLPGLIIVKRGMPIKDSFRDSHSKIYVPVHMDFGFSNPVIPVDVNSAIHLKKNLLGDDCLHGYQWSHCINKDQQIIINNIN